MDSMAPFGTGTPDRPGAENARQAMGLTRRCANRMNLTEVVPHGELASSGYCLANPGKEYLGLSARWRRSDDGCVSGVW